MRQNLSKVAMVFGVGLLFLGFRDPNPTDGAAYMALGAMLALGGWLWRK